MKVSDTEICPADPLSVCDLLIDVSKIAGQLRRRRLFNRANARGVGKALGALIASNEVTENTPFTPEEQKEIVGRLDELANYVRKTHSLSRAQMQALDEKLEYLVDASGRLGRKDWLNAFIGVTLAFMLSAALAPEAARAMFLTFLRAIGLLYPELPID
jgi:hypothetical protein